MTSTRCSTMQFLHFNISKLRIPRHTGICWFWMETQVRILLRIHRRFSQNCIVLWYLADLAESDLIYTESIMRRGVEVYEGKEILLLGGGDGGLLRELLKENPKQVTMIEVGRLKYHLWLEFKCLINDAAYCVNSRLTKWWLTRARNIYEVSAATCWTICLETITR